MPSSHDAEKSVLCSFLLDPNRVGGMLAESAVGDEWFHFPAHRAVYGALARLYADGKAVDVVSTANALHSSGVLESCGGMAGLSEIYGFWPTAVNAEYHLAILRDKRTLREIVRIGTEYAALAYEEPEDPQSLLAGLERAAMGVSGNVSGEEKTFGEHVASALDRAEQRALKKTGLIGIPTGLSELDKLTGGLAKGDLVVVSAETSGGKTALACRFVASASSDGDEVSAVFSYEMSNDELTDRLLVEESRINMLTFRQGWLSETDFQNLTRGAAKLRDAKIFLRDDSEMSISQVRASARRIKAKHGLGLVVIDYAQLVPESSGRKGSNREQEVAHVSRQCKAMAKELKVPVVVLSQLNEDGKVRESRAIAHDANMVLVIQEEDERHYIRIAKQRNGPRERVPVTFVKQFCRFQNYAP